MALTRSTDLPSRSTQVLLFKRVAHAKNKCGCRTRLALTGATHVDLFAHGGTGAHRRSEPRSPSPRHSPTCSWKRARSAIPVNNGHVGAHPREDRVSGS